MKITRRSFLSSAIAAAAAPTIVPSSVFGANAPSNRVNLAAIGVGFWGSHYGWNEFAAKHDNMRFVAVADCYKSRREKFAAKVNEKDGANTCTTYLDYHEILQRDDVDGVVIHTSDHWHLPVAIHAAEAGKDIFLAKPVGLDIDLAKRLRKIVAEKKLLAAYGTQQRSMAFCRLGVDLVLSGFIGKIKRAEVWSPALPDPKWGSRVPAEVPEDLDFDRWIGPAPMKPYTKDRCTRNASWHVYDYSLGFIAGWGAHPLDILQWGLNTDHTSPVRYEGAGTFPDPEALADTIATWDVTFEYADGLPVRFMSNRIAEPIVREYHPAWREDGTTFHGEDGWVSVSRGACYAFKNGKQVNVSTIELSDDERKAYVSDDHPGNFIDCMHTRKPTVAPLEAGIRSDTISHMSNAAIRLGRAIKWDPQKEEVIGDSEAAAMLTRPMRPPYTVD